MEDKKPEENKMEIEISKYKDLVDALSDPVRVARMVLLIAAVAAIFAVGIVAVVCGIKRFYPYKSINSNPYGATIIHDEDNEIIYWLFNTADLWANSGIEVDEGDIISVRTSGAFHTAIHHLVDDANSNTSMENLWVPSKGGGLTERSPLYYRDKARLKYCIAPDLEYNTILMQVVPEDICRNKENPNWRTDSKHQCYIDGIPDTLYQNDYFKNGIRAKLSEADIYEIGSGKENIRIRTNGILHFVVNDIALTRRIISKMQKDTTGLKIKPVKDVWFAKTTDEFNELFTPVGLNAIKQTYEERDNRKGDTLKIDTISSEELNLQHFKSIGIIDEYGHPVKDYWNKESPLYTQLVDKNECLVDTIIERRLILEKLKLLDSIWQPNELDYYKYNNFVDAWFADNIGSFMIVIERKRVK